MAINPTHHGLPHCGSQGKLRPPQNTRKSKSPRGPFSDSGGRHSPQLGPGARLQEVATLGPSQAGGRRGSLRDATRVPAQTPTQAARSRAHTATVSGDVPREVRASGTAGSAASSMGEPRGAYLGQPSAAPRPAPEEPPRTCRETWTQVSDVNRARTGRAQLRPRPCKPLRSALTASGRSPVLLIKTIQHCYSKSDFLGTLTWDRWDRGRGFDRKGRKWAGQGDRFPGKRR